MRLPKKKLVRSIVLLTILLISYSFSTTPLQTKNQAPQTASFSPTRAPQSNKNSPNVLASTPSHSPTSSSSSLPSVKVLRVVDGDTIVLEGNTTLRYIGINTPETVDPRRKIQCFGKEASNRNKELVEGQTVQLEKDISETDRFGRLLRYVYINGEMVNEKLVREGYAQASAYPPDIKHQDRLKAAENDARMNKRGLWANCQLQ